MAAKDPRAEAIRHKILELAGSNLAEFARRIDLPPQRLYDLDKRGDKPSLKMIIAVLEAHPEISPRWLVENTGEQFRAGMEPITKSAGLLGEMKKKLEQIWDSLDEMKRNLMVSSFFLWAASPITAIGPPAEAKPLTRSESQSGQSG